MKLNVLKVVLFIIFPFLHSSCEQLALEYYEEFVKPEIDVQLSQEAKELDLPINTMEIVTDGDSQLLEFGKDALWFMTCFHDEVVQWVPPDLFWIYINYNNGLEDEDEVRFRVSAHVGVEPIYSYDYSDIKLFVDINYVNGLEIDERFANKVCGGGGYYCGIEEEWAEIRFGFFYDVTENSLKAIFDLVHEQTGRHFIFRYYCENDLNIRP